MFRRVTCAVSGGVDSAVSAYMLKERGFDVTGVFIKSWNPEIEDEGGGSTPLRCSEEDRADAEIIAGKLGIQFGEVDLTKQYWAQVFTNMLNEYTSARSPNPDILCNHYIKFDAFYQLAKSRFMADAIATGHYARSSFGRFLKHYKSDATARLLTAQDSIKCQTFFLSRVPQKALRETMFPVGDLAKSQVKAIARDIGLGWVAEKRSTKGICFIGKRSFPEFLDNFIPKRQGCFIDFETGQIVGKHEGIHHFTIGQRAKIKGLGAGGAFYVLRRDVKTQNVIVVRGQFNSALLSDSFTSADVFWISGIPKRLLTLGAELDCDVKFHNTNPSVCGTLSFDEFGVLHVKLKHPQRAMAPGQYGVFYLGDQCLGSACIDSVGPSFLEQNRNFQVLGEGQYQEKVVAI